MILSDINKSVNPSTGPESGLTNEQVAASRTLHGRNELEAKRKSEFLAALTELIREPMLILLVVAACIYFLTGALQEGAFMLGAIILMAAMSLYQDTKSRNALRQLKTLIEPKCRAIRNGSVEEILIEDLVVGDWVILEEGTRVPADGVIRQAHDFSVNEAALTGESMARFKDPAGEDNLVFQGTLVATGRAVAEISAVGKQTKLGKIGESLTSIEQQKTPLQIQIAAFVKNMAFAGVLVFLIVWLINYSRSGNFLDSLLKALTLAMSILPEEIPVAFTTFMALGAYRLMKMGIIVKKTQTIEALGSATVICTDKTGTITENKMTLASLYVFSENSVPDHTENVGPAGAELISMAMWASEPDPFDPMEIALHDAYQRLSPVDQRRSFNMIREYPLSGQPPMMTHVFENKHGERIVAAKGAPEAMIQVSQLSENDKHVVLNAMSGFTEKGFRVLGVGCSEFPGNAFPEKQQDLSFTFLGLVAFYDPPKANIRSVFESFYRAGIQVKIITGDNAATTRHIAEQAGFIGADAVMTGEELLSIDEQALGPRVMQTRIFARMFPDAKLRVINALKAQGEVVAMTGDGVNDAPALKASHIGIAMGRKGTEVARQASDLILTSDDLAGMVDAIATGRKIYTNLKNAIRYIISIHIPIILIVFVPLAWAWKYTAILTPVHIIFFELIMGPTCSIIYENEPSQRDVLTQKPRPLASNLFEWKELGVSIMQGLVITAGILGIYWYAVTASLAEPTVRAMVFIGVVSANIALTLVNRSFYFSVFTTLKHKNPLVPLIISITIAMTFLIFFIPSVTNFFQLEVPSLMQIVLCIATGIVSVLWFESVKWFQRQ